jgi:Fe2+ or Zn2+ uptake regulation protein
MSRPFRYREPIVALLEDNPIHPTADWIHLHLRSRHPRVGLATVYRTLKLLVADGTVCELHFGTSESRFGLLAGPPHDHFFCEKCRTVMALPARRRTAIKRSVEARTGHQISRHSMEFFGVCRNCLGRTDPGSARDSRGRSSEDDRGSEARPGKGGRPTKRRTGERS